MITRITLLCSLIIMSLSSCSTDIEVNNPSLQTEIDGKLFRSSKKSATIYDDGTLVISGFDGEKSISFTVQNAKIGTYKTAGNTANKAKFQKRDVVYNSTENTTVGEVVINEIYNNSISGNFYFNNLKDKSGNSSNFTNGWFYRLPITEANTPVPVVVPTNPCLDRATLTALVNGTAITTSSHTASIFGVNDSSVLISASNATEDITMVFDINTVPGTYSLSGSGNYTATYAINNDKSSARNGNLIITDHNQSTKCIAGSFEFTTRSGVQITAGSFEFGY